MCFRLRVSGRVSPADLGKAMTGVCEEAAGLANQAASLAQ